MQSRHPKLINHAQVEEKSRNLGELLARHSPGATNHDSFVIYLAC